ncbi:MAG TPA: DUF459 domain-containing protein [Gaiellaceae bacterium]|nr:DUF459 domain-containing protein [Gaiellaceae bacterium]
MRRLPPSSAGRAVVVLFLALAFAAVLEAEGLRKQAEIQPAGFERNLALRVTKPLVAFSRALHLTTPRHDLQVAIGRGGEDRIDTQVHLTLPPPAGPRPRKPKSAKHPPKPPVVHRPLFTAARPLRVWVAGDSLAEVPGQALERVGGAVDVVGVESRLSTGLTRPDLYNWFTRIEQAPRQLHPKVAVLSFGADDAHDYMAGVPEGRSVGPLGSPSWNAEYRRRVDGVTRELIARGILVVWLGLPIPDGPGFRRSFPIVNRILAGVAAAHPGKAVYVDTWHLLDDAHGRYTAYLRVHGTLTLMRLPDGVHYTAAAGDLIAAQLLKQLGAFYVLRA